MIYLLVPLYIICCLFLIGVVLLQQGKGADLAGAFGAGGGTQAAFGARSATTLLHKLTTWAFVGFIVLSLGISILQSRRDKTTVMADLPAKKPAAASAVSAVPPPPLTAIPVVPATAGN